MSHSRGPLRRFRFPLRLSLIAIAGLHLVLSEPHLASAQPAESMNAQGAEDCRLVQLKKHVIHGFTPESPLACPIRIKSQASMHDYNTVVVCDWKTLCGKDYGVLRNESGLRMHALSSDFDVVEPEWERSDIPILPAKGNSLESAICLRSVVSEQRGAPFFVIDPNGGESGVISDVRRLRLGTELFVCRRYGQFLVSYIEHSRGLLPTDSVSLEEIKLDRSYLETRSRNLCHSVAWDGKLNRQSFLYTLEGAVLSKMPESIKAEQPVRVLSVVRGRSLAGRPWYHVLAKGQDGYLPPAAVTLDAGFTQIIPASPRHNCPAVVATARLTCRQKATPLAWAKSDREDPLPSSIRLEEPTVVPVISMGKRSLKVLVFDTVASLPRNNCVEVVEVENLALGLQPETAACPVVWRNAGGGASLRLRLLGLLDESRIPERVHSEVRNLADQLQGTGSSMEILSNKDGNLPIRDITASDLSILKNAGADNILLRAAVLGTSRAKDVYDALDDTLATFSRPSAPKDCMERSWADEQASLDLNSWSEANAKLIVLLVEEDFLELLRSLPDCLAGQCSSVERSFLAGAAFHGLGLHLLARETFTDLLESDDLAVGAIGWHILLGIRLSLKKTGTSRRTKDALARICSRSSGLNFPKQERGEACLIAAQLAAELDELADASALVARVDGGRPDDVRSMELAARLQVLQGDQGGVRAYVAALGATAASCPLSSERAQKTALQLARAAYSFDDKPIAYKLLSYLLPSTLMDAPVLTMQLLADPGDFRRAASFLSCSGRHERQFAVSPEYAITMGYVLTGKCRFAQADRALRGAEHRLERLDDLAQALDKVVGGIQLQGGATLSATAVMKMVNKVLIKHGVASSDIPELQSILSPSGACGEWWAVTKEKQQLSEIEELLSYAGSRFLQRRLTILRDELEKPCVWAMSTTARSIRKRSGGLTVATHVLRDDLRYAVEGNWDSAILLLQRMVAMAKRNFCDDMRRWSSGEDPTWIEAIDGLLLPFHPSCDRENAVKLSSQQRQQLSEATNRSSGVCTTGSPQPYADYQDSAWTAVDQLLGDRAGSALECFVQAGRHGAKEAGLLLLVRRYLPGLILLNHEIIDTVDLSAFSPQIATVLRTYADGSRRLKDSICAPVGARSSR